MASDPTEPELLNALKVLRNEILKRVDPPIEGPHLGDIVDRLAGVVERVAVMQAQIMAAVGDLQARVAELEAHREP